MKDCTTFVLLGLLTMASACSRQPSALSSKDNAAAKEAASLIPHRNETSGVSPTHALAGRIIPRGTEIVVRLQSRLLSTNSHPGESFLAAVDKPIAVRGDVLIPRGAKVNGRVVSVHATSTRFRPAFLRLTLSSVEIAGKSVILHTSAVFTKSVVPNPNSVANSGIASGIPNSGFVEFSTDRKLIFWLVQASPL